LWLLLRIWIQVLLLQFWLSLRIQRVGSIRAPAPTMTGEKGGSPQKMLLALPNKTIMAYSGVASIGAMAQALALALTRALAPILAFIWDPSG
jgi:hypothetical protein